MTLAIVGGLRRACGFMLIEVLVALAVLSVGITGLMMGMSASLDRAKQTKELSTAIFLAQYIMTNEEELYLFSDEVATTNRGTFYDEGLPEYEWESDTEVDRDYNEYVITVTIRWTHKGREKHFSISQLVPAHTDTLEEMGRRSRGR